MSFFANGAINRVNLHYGVQQFAQGAGGVFLLVYLLRAGVSVPMTLAAQASFSILRLAMRPGVLWLVKRLGLRRTLICGVLAEALAMPILAQVHGVDAWFVTLVLVAPIGSVLYWTCFHAYFAALGDAEARGGQVGAREALAAVVGIAAPLAGAWALVTFGPQTAFLAVAGLQALAAAPLVGGPDVSIADEAPGALRASMAGARLFAADGWFAACYYYVWQIALFVTLHQNFAAYGGAMALAALAGAVGSLVIGRRIDLGHGRVALLVAYGVAAAVIVAKAASFGAPWLAVGANATGAIVAGLVAPALMTPVYNLAKASPCPLRFHMAAEGGWDIGCSAGCLTAAAAYMADGSLTLPLLLGLAGVAAAVALLWRQYAPAPA